MSDRDLLRRLCAGPASGAALAAELGQSRAAVWKRIQALRAAGVEIEARAGLGYALAQPIDLLDGARIRDALSARAAAELAALEVHFEIDSSNALALRESVPVRGSRVFLCERQSAGRGRRGRDWASPLAANLYLSVSRRFEGGLASLQGLSLAVGVAAVQALHALGFGQARLKWPNDLVVFEAGRLCKLGGILIEVGGEAGGPLRAVIGLGLNVAMPVRSGAGIDQAWTDLRQLAGGATVSRNRLAAAVLDRLLPLLAEFESTGLAPWLGAWEALDALAGRRVQVLAADGVREGRALGIAADGALRVEHAGAEARYHGGEVSLREGAA